MKGSRKKIAIGVVVAAPLVVLAVLASGPYRALSAVRDAAAAGDHTALRTRIDFDQVKAGLKEDWKAKLAAQAGAGPAAKTFSDAEVDQIVEDWAAPDALGRAARNEAAEKEKPAAFSEVENELITGGDDMHGTYLSLDRFRADFKHGRADAFSVTLTRRGLTWRIVRLDLVELRRP